ncbi:MAG TPA: thioredoxin domain-containing protein [Devosiaceae bacterium]|nr:thioredoxin domain-containing protein [Devosiaceae bacterium]
MFALLRPFFISLLLLAPLGGVAMAAEPPAAVAATTASQVVSFENEAQLDSLAAKGKTIVYFYAAWCPECRATVTDLNARWNRVRPNLTLVIADYDQEKALKAKYGVTYQDTFVLLDAKGAAVKSWNGGGLDGLNDNTRS